MRQYCNVLARHKQEEPRDVIALSPCRDKQMQDRYTLRHARCKTAQFIMTKRLCPEILPQDSIILRPQNLLSRHYRSPVQLLESMLTQEVRMDRLRRSKLRHSSSTVRRGTGSCRKILQSCDSRSVRLRRCHAILPGRAPDLPHRGQMLTQGGATLRALKENLDRCSPTRRRG
jgi:hypothetical protein